MIDGDTSEEDFAALVDACAAAEDADGLLDLLREDHHVYDQRSSAAVVRMRGWILLALGRIGLPDRALPHVLEELDTGHDGYLVAAAARAVRARVPQPQFAPFLVQALENQRYQDDAVVLDTYGAYATGPGGTTPIREVLAALRWHAAGQRALLPQLRALRTPDNGLPKTLLPDLEETIAAVEGDLPQGQSPSRASAISDVDCCDWRRALGVFSWSLRERADSGAVAGVLFEDQNGDTTSYAELFEGHPSIVVFFYTRCDNPQKCSLTLTKLAGVQRLLARRSLDTRVHTAAVTYDAGFDRPERLRAYGKARGMRMDDGHRLLRPIDGIDVLRSHFGLGLNFIGSLVNRHRVELYVLDSRGRIAFRFARLHWNEADVVDRAVELLHDEPTAATVAPTSTSQAKRIGSLTVGTTVSLAVALFPKCPVCWATYMSGLGLSGLVTIPYAPWLNPILLGALLVNVSSVYWRARTVGRLEGLALVVAGAGTIVATKLGWLPEPAALCGVALTLIGSVMSTWWTTRSFPLASARRAVMWRDSSNDLERDERPLALGARRGGQL
jgi:protein SCO1/2